jgi:cytochrome P450 RapN
MADPRSTCPVHPFPSVAGQGLDPDPILGTLRDTEGIARIQPPYGGDCWIALRYDDVKAVLSDPRFSRSATIGLDVARTQPVLHIEGSILGMDGADHTRIRRLVSATFTARRVEALRPRAQEVVDGLLDAMAAHGSPADLVEMVALPLPITMICELLGVPYDDRHRFRGWADTFMTSGGFTVEEVMDAHERLAVYLAGMIADRRREPTVDLLGALVAVRDADGDRLGEDELVRLAIAILVAGYETTASQLGKFMLCLFERPDQLARLRERPDLLPGAVEELMRFVPLSSGTSIAHLATEDVEVGGMLVRAGDAIMASGAAANRDPGVFLDPERVDIERTDASQLGFGHGPHFCLGAHLARMELQVAIGSLLARFPELALAVAPDAVRWKTTSSVWGLEELPVAF